MADTAELPRLSIGKVLAELQPEFPDLTHSKLRFLEAEGLIEPERTASGYRKFSFDDVERLRFILRTQKEHFWPLNHIRSVLEQMDRGEVPDTTPGAMPQLRLAADGLPTAETFIDAPSQIRLSRQDLLDRAAISDELLVEIEQHGLIERRPHQKFYSGDDLAVAQLAAQFDAFGVQPRHLRSMRTAAEREAALIAQVLTPRDNNADDTAAVAALSVHLHTLLLRRHLRG